MNTNSPAYVIIALCGLLLIIFALAGCSVDKFFTAHTYASVNPKDGFRFDSSKNQENLHATGEMGADGSLSFEVTTTATTPESAIAAAANAQAAATKALTDILSAVLPIVQQAIQAGAASQGIPLPKPAPKPVPQGGTTNAPTVSSAPAPALGVTP